MVPDHLAHQPEYQGFSFFLVIGGNAGDLVDRRRYLAESFPGALRQTADVDVPKSAIDY